MCTFCWIRNCGLQITGCVGCSFFKRTIAFASNFSAKEPLLQQTHHPEWVSLVGVGLSFWHSPFRRRVIATAPTGGWCARMAGRWDPHTASANRFPCKIARMQCLSGTISDCFGQDCDSSLGLHCNRRMDLSEKTFFLRIPFSKAEIEGSHVNNKMFDVRFHLTSQLGGRCHEKLQSGRLKKIESKRRVPNWRLMRNNGERTLASLSKSASDDRSSTALNCSGWVTIHYCGHPPEASTSSQASFWAVANTNLNLKVLDVSTKICASFQWPRSLLYQWASGRKGGATAICDIHLNARTHTMISQGRRLVSHSCLLEHQ